jgi:hypothetical protein
MSHNLNYIYSILSNINWNYHIVFTYPYLNQRNNTLEGIKLRQDKLFKFTARLSSFLKLRRNQHIYAYSDEYSDAQNGHLHALYKLPEKYQGNDQQFIAMAQKVWPSALGISPARAQGINKLNISTISQESYQNKVNYVAKKIMRTDSPSFLSKEAKKMIATCNSEHGNRERN